MTEAKPKPKTETPRALHFNQTRPEARPRRRASPSLIAALALLAGCAVAEDTPDRSVATAPISTPENACRGARCRPASCRVEGGSVFCTHSSNADYTCYQNCGFPDAGALCPDLSDDELSGCTQFCNVAYPDHGSPWLACAASCLNSLSHDCQLGEVL